MGSCLSLRFCPSRYLRHQERLHQGNTFSHYSLAGSRQGSRVSCVELYPAFAFEDSSSLNLSDVDLDTSGVMFPACGCSVTGSCQSCASDASNVAASTALDGRRSYAKRPSVADRWSQIVLEESELDAQQQRQEASKTSMTAAATAWSLASSPQLDRAAVGSVGFGYEQFSVDPGENVIVDSGGGIGDVAAPVSERQGVEGGFWRSLRRRTEFWRFPQFLFSTRSSKAQGNDSAIS